MSEAKTPEKEIERRKKISNAHKGRKHPRTTERNKINNPAKKGSEHYLWNGGNEKYWKKQILLRDDFICQICGFSEKDIMQVDHIKPKSVFPELRFEINNLITLCPNCHARKTQREKKQKYERKLYE